LKDEKLNICPSFIDFILFFEGTGVNSGPYAC
jgi:hypothetical protein